MKKGPQVTAALPLTGITVFEFGHSVAAPFGGLILAGLGAEVIKIENPKKGDHTRDWGPPYNEDGTAVLFNAINRDKRSIAVNLKDPAAVQVLRQLILEKGDVVIQNLRPGVIQQFGLGAEEMTRAKEALIYCNISAYGHKGPYRDRPGYDPVMQAFGGLMSITGEEGRPPVRVGAPLIDMGSGMWSAIAILAALLDRSRTGRGKIIDTSLYETSLAWMSFPIATYLATGEIPVRCGSGVPQVVPYQVFATADNYLMVAAGNDNLFERLSEVLGHPEWPVSEKFASNGKRVQNRVELLTEIERIFRTRPTQHWIEMLEQKGIPNAPMQTTDAVTESVQTQVLDIIQTHREAGFRLLGLPLSFNGERPPFRGAPPALGEANTMLKHGPDGTRSEG